jgi:hypothetical protein
VDSLLSNFWGGLFNSGKPANVFFNKTVVSPAIGNMTEYLDNKHNFSFDPFDSSSVLGHWEKDIK